MECILRYVNMYLGLLKYRQDFDWNPSNLKVFGVLELKVYIYFVVKDITIIKLQVSNVRCRLIFLYSLLLVVVLYYIIQFKLSGRCFVKPLPLKNN